MNKEDWDDRCNRGIFGLVLAMLVFTPLAFGGVGPWEFLVVQALAAGVAVLWAVRLWLNDKPRFLCPPLVWAVLAFALYGAVRHHYCDVEYAARIELIQVVVCTVVFLAVLNNLYHQDMMQTICYTLIAVAMAGSSYAVGQYLTHSNRVWYQFSPDVGRASGTFLGPDHFCAFLEMVLPLLMAILLAGRIKAMTRVLLGYSLIAIMAGAVVTFSRAGWVASVVGTFFVLLVLVAHRNHRKFAGLTLLVLTGGGILFVTRILMHTLTYMERVQTAEGRVNTDIFIRKEIWISGLRMWLSHLWWGVGPGGFDWFYNEYRTQAVQMRAGWAHCEYLNLLTDWGLAGALIVLAGIMFVILGVVRTWRRVRRSENDFGNPYSNRFAVFLGLLGGLVAVSIHSLVDFCLHVPANELLAATLLALLASNLRFATERYWFKARVPARLAATLALLGAAFWLGAQDWRLSREAWWLARAADAPEHSVAQASLRETAFRCEPMNFENACEIGECYRESAVKDADNPGELLDSAMRWYQTSQTLNPHYSPNYLGLGASLDDEGNFNAAQKYYDQADLHDPNAYYVAAGLGSHYLHAGNYAAARECLQRSVNLDSKNNALGEVFLQIAEQNLAAEAAAHP